MIQWYHLRFQSRHSPEAQEVEQSAILEGGG
uniref:Uncharacterized protein n=1 Tax=Rhizophora mucronata TaxID=61149 RepID=A0A2P2JW50_RHIMU